MGARSPNRGVRLGVTASFGLASLAAEQRATLEDPGLWLLRQADTALYAAKAQGRNRVVTATSAGHGSTAALAADPLNSPEH